MTDLKETTTIDAGEIERFSAMAEEWWDPDGKFRPLHQLNPARLGWIRDRICDRHDRDPRTIRPLSQLSVLDVGCGGGLVAEPMARMGANVTAIDASEKNIGIAETHAHQSELTIDYQATTAEALASAGQAFDAVLALEIVEHVADIDLFLHSLTALTKPGGTLIMSTINRTPRAWLFAIAGAEYVMRWLPVGTHQYRKFVRPSELTHGLAAHRGKVTDISGMVYNPLTGDWRTGRDVGVNYMVCAEVS